MNNDQDFSKYIGRIADALERLAPALPAAPNLKDSDAFVWNADHNQLKPATNINLVHLALLKGISRTRDTLLNNTLRFAKELPANNALLWGARGMGKSSLVKAVHARINQDTPNALALIEIHLEVRFVLAFAIGSVTSTRSSISIIL